MRPGRGAYSFRVVRDDDSRPSLTDFPTERALLGAFMLYPERIADAVRDGLAPSSFAPGHAVVFAAMVRLGPESILARPYGALHDELARADHLRLAGGAAALVWFLIDALEPHLIGAAIERLVTLAHARVVQRVLREALLVVERDPSCADQVLGELRGEP